LVLTTIQEGAQYIWAISADRNGIPNDAIAQVVQVDAQAAGTNSTLTATLAAAIGKTTYIEGFEVTSGIGTVAGAGELSISGVAGGPWLYEFVASIAGGVVLQKEWIQARPAVAPNTTIVVILPALGLTTGKVSLVVHGYQL